MSDAQDSRTGTDWRVVVKTLLLCVLIAGGGVFLVSWIYDTEPTAEREGASKKSAMLVEVTEVRRDTHRPRITSMGTVTAARDIVLRARVAGEVVAIGETFAPGGFVDAGALLVRLDAGDYEAEVQQRLAELRQAQAALDVEGGRQDVARAELKRANLRVPEADEELALRKPQLKAAKAQVALARAALRRARLDLDRTRVEAPFAAQIMSRAVDVGSQVQPGAELARLVGTGTYWIEATVPLSKLRWLVIPSGDAADDSANGTDVVVRHRAAWPEGSSRTGRVLRLLGELDGPTRMARVLVAVDDPLGASAGTPRLMLGGFVEVELRASPIPDVVRLERELLRKRDTVWVMQDGKLDIREVDVVFRGDDHVFVSEGLADGDRVVSTDLATVVDGAALRLADGK